MSVQIVDAFGAAQDPGLPFLRRALDPREAAKRIVPLLERAIGESAGSRLREIRVARHKAGRRCVVEYRFEIERTPHARESLRVFGKARARGTNVTSHDLAQALWQAGFRADREHAMAVPEPIGVVPEFHMTLQRGVPGRVATELLDGSQGLALMGRVAEAIHALHVAGIPTRKRHTMADELRILGERLPRVARTRPQWSSRIARLLRACELRASRVDEPPSRGIHRDFYSDQVIVDGRRLHLLDLDLYTRGDPALDVGNFIGHLTELSLRRWGDPEVLRDREEALAERYLELCRDVSRTSLETYAALTLARHVYISTTIPARRRTTSDLLDLCEQRLRAS